MSEGMASSTFNFSVVDQELAAGIRQFDVPLFKAYLANYLSHPLLELANQWKARSMLAVQSLLLMRAFALQSKGAILEIGAYMGGGTVALAHGARSAGGKTMVTIEAGGAHDHPTLPTTDIVADWHKTLSMFGFDGAVNLAVGWANSEQIAKQALEAIGPESIGLVVIDANGMAWENLYYYRHKLADDCIFVFDDYGNEIDAAGNVKFETTLVSVDGGVDAGALVRYGVAPWSTWYGARGPQFLNHIEGARIDERRRVGWIK